MAGESWEAGDTVRLRQTVVNELPLYHRDERNFMNESRRLLQHFLAALAYRTQKALRGAPAGFATYRAGDNVRTPGELVRHMTSVTGYARTMLHGGTYRPAPLPTMQEEVARFHEMLAALQTDFGNDELSATISDEQFLQGPLSDAMTHAGQLAMLRRLFGDPVASENFIYAHIRTDDVGEHQPEPAAPDADWTPNRKPK
ncbi:MAG: hypothetical protein ABI969_05845 [bacterium]